jgi:hypothetical protein
LLNGSAGTSPSQQAAFIWATLIICETIVNTHGYIKNEEASGGRPAAAGGDFSLREKWAVLTWTETLRRRFKRVNSFMFASG